MRKSMKLVAAVVLFTFVSGVGAAQADPVPDRAAATAGAAPPQSIRKSIERLQQSSLLLAPARPAKAATAAAQSNGGGRGLGGAAKAAIWIGAVTVAGVWAYKTFSVTRGTD